jgi:hypothetical protein
MPCSTTAMKKTFASIAVAITAIGGAIGAAEAMVIDFNTAPAQAMSAAAAERSDPGEEFDHFRFDNAIGVTGITNVAVQQLATGDTAESALDSPDVVARPAGEAPEPGVVLLVALGLVVIIRIRRQQIPSE